VIRQLAPERPAALEYSTDAPSATGLVAAAAAIRGAAVALSGLILAAGLAMVLWAVTPSSGAEMATALQGGVVAFAAANLIPVSIGGVTLTLPPLLLTVTIAALLASTVKRGRFLPRGRYQETISILVTAGVYGLVVAATTRGLGPPDAVPPGWVWAAFALAVVATTAGHLRNGSAWHTWWIAVAPAWVRYGTGGGGIGLGVMIAGGGIALSVGLIARFGTALSVSALAAPSWMDGLGMAMLGLAYVPNAVIAGAGYITGVGFEIGPGSYSPLASSTVDLPAVPLLAAAPDQAGRSLLGLLFLAVPLIAGYLIVIPAVRNLATRSDRVLAAATGSLLAGALLAGAAAIARGGVGDGRWSTFGVPPLLLGAVAAAEIGVVALSFAVLTGWRTVPWRLERTVPAKRAEQGRVEPEEPAGSDADGADADGADADGADDDVTAEDRAAEDVTADDGPADDSPADDSAADDPAEDERR